MKETTLRRINLTPTRNHSVKSHYGTRDYYKYFHKKNKKLGISSTLYRRVLRKVNEKIRTKIATLPYDFKLPKRLGVIQVRKYYPEFILDGNRVIKNKMAVDFKRTLKLWEEDPSAMDEKIFIYYENDHSDGFIFKIMYNKSTAIYKNKSIYKFRPNRLMKAMLNKSIKEDHLDAFLLK